MYIILTEQQVQELLEIKVQDNYKLKPYKILTGEYVLPESVLNDNAYCNAHNFLNRLEKRELSENVLPKGLKL